MTYLLILLALFLGILFGMFIGLRAYAAQRAHIDYALQQMDDNVTELSRLMHDGRITPEAVRTWIASIRTDFAPTRRWR